MKTFIFSWSVFCVFAAVKNRNLLKVKKRCLRRVFFVAKKGADIPY